MLGVTTTQFTSSSGVFVEATPMNNLTLSSLEGRALGKDFCVGRVFCLFVLVCFK